MRIRFRQEIVTLLMAGVVSAQSVPALPQSNGATQQEIVKAAVEKIGVGKRAAVRLVTGDVIRGHITRIGEDSFSLLPTRGKASREIPYSHVTQLKKNSSTVLWAVLGVSLVAIVVIVVAIARTPKTQPYTPPAM